LVNNIGQQELEFPQFRSVTDISSIVAATFSNEIAACKEAHHAAQFAKMLLGDSFGFCLKILLSKNPLMNTALRAKASPVASTISALQDESDHLFRSQDRRDFRSHQAIVVVEYDLSQIGISLPPPICGNRSDSGDGDGAGNGESGEGDSLSVLRARGFESYRQRLFRGSSPFQSAIPHPRQS
jgi:hypothetical protein